MMLRANKHVDLADDLVRYVWTDKNLEPHEYRLSASVGRHRDLKIADDLAHHIGLMIRSTNFTIFAPKFTAPNGCKVEIVECLTAHTYAVVCGPYIIDSEMTAIDAARCAASMLLWEEDTTDLRHLPQV